MSLMAGWMMLLPISTAMAPITLSALSPLAKKAIKDFQQGVDAAAVYAECFYALYDGGEFGLGAEIGISTQKLHVRGPFALEALTSMKILVNGTGQVRE